MKLLRRITGLAILPVIGAVGLLRRLLPGDPEGPSGLRAGATYRAAWLRTLAAPSWRKLIRWALVILGFSIFAGLQLVMAMLIDRLWWWFIVAFFIIVGCFALAASKPTIAYVSWLVISPIGFILLRLDFGAGLPAISFDRVAIPMLGVLLVSRTLIRRQPIRRLVVGEWLAVLFPAYVIVSLAAGRTINLIAIISDQFDHLGLALILYFVTKACIERREHIVWVLAAIVFVGVYSAGFGFYEHYTGYQWFGSFLSAHVQLATMDIEKGRAAGPLLNPSAYGTFLGIAALIALHMFAWTRRSATRIYYLAAAVFMVVGTYFCFTRGGYVSLVLGVVLMPFLARGGRRLFAGVGVAAAILAVATLPILLSNPQFNERMSKVSTITGRLVVTATTMNVIRHNLLFGVGLGNIDYALEKYITNAGGLSGLYARNYSPNQPRLAPVITSHNSVLTVLAEEGILGGALFLGAIIALLIRMFHVRARLPSEGLLGKDFVAVMVVSLVGYYASILTYDVRYFKFPTYVSWILIAVVVRLGELMDQEQAETVAAPAEQPRLVREYVHA